MSLKNVTPGDKAPEAFNVVIEIPMHGDPIKYEVDKQSGALFVDRFMSAAMYYPAKLRLRAADAGRRRRSGGRAGRHSRAATAWRNIPSTACSGGPCPARVPRSRRRTAIMSSRAWTSGRRGVTLSARSKLGS